LRRALLIGLLLTGLWLILLLTLLLALLILLRERVCAKARHESQRYRNARDRSNAAKFCWVLHHDSFSLDLGFYGIPGNSLFAGPHLSI